MEFLKQGTRIVYDVEALKGTGTIVGVALTGQPIIGVCYIVEPDIPLKSEIYDYTHFVVWEYQFRLL